MVSAAGHRLHAERREKESPPRNHAHGGLRWWPRLSTSRATLFSVILIYWLAGRRVKEQDLIAIAVPVPLGVPFRTKVEHLSDRVCECVEGALADALSLQPVILDEPDDRTLVGESVIDEVRFGEWRDYQKRLARAVAATSFDAGQGRAMATHTGSVQLVAIVHNARVDRRGVDDW